MNSNKNKPLSDVKVRALLVIEVLGRPPEHLNEVLEKMCNKIAEEDGVEVKEKKIHEIKELEKKKGFFTNFAEVEVETDNIVTVSGLMFKYMPAHVEILSPENISLQNNDFTVLFNELTRRLHGYDEIARVVQAQKIMLEKKLKEVLEKQKSGKAEDKADGKEDKAENKTEDKNKDKEDKKKKK